MLEGELAFAALCLLMRTSAFHHQYTIYGVAAVLSESKMDQNGILAFARPKWTIFGQFWPQEVHVGPFRSANRTLAIPNYYNLADAMLFWGLSSPLLVFEGGGIKIRFVDLQGRAPPTDAPDFVVFVANAAAIDEPCQFTYYVDSCT